MGKKRATKRLLEGPSKKAQGQQWGMGNIYSKLYNGMYDHSRNRPLLEDEREYV